MAVVDATVFRSLVDSYCAPRDSAAACVNYLPDKLRAGTFNPLGTYYFLLFSSAILKY